MAAPKPISPTDPGPLSAVTPGGVDPIRAATLAAQICRAGKVASWRELGDHPEVRARVVLTSEQEQLLAGAAPLLAWLSVDPKRLPYRCADCGSIAFFGAGNPPSRCILTPGCDGKPIKTQLVVSRRTTK